ncbi:peptidylprolyl isomerase [Maribacter cobaltidurans]|uniref:peptidylprolyl isomerase n=1 Tax=Maribacter cobaltidurans TaxID=1178778 RepID=A0A223V0N6_9FLAO|nr:peptidylprolyl isomerase [Maribacter cobaltidurans]ASV28911.1 peptidylprolyl isomerase [Maribacter cobaltidurans]GGD73778.1 peptidylprolyl isomerase [Maribacter cobaltidurans]
MINKMYLLAALALIMASCKTSQRADLGDGLFADIKTSKGDIIVKLEHEKTPVTVANFVSLAEGNSPFVSENYKGKKYYDGLTFHRVMKDFMIQGGDPLGMGTGNPGYKFMDEFNDSLVHDKKGILSMANSGPATNGSQFFITHAPTPWLDNRHSVFGEVVEGMDVVDSIANVKVTVGSNKPVEPVTMNTIEIIRNGKEAKKFDAVKVMTEYFDGEEERLAAIEKEKEKKLEELKKVKEEFIAETSKQKEEAKSFSSGLKLFPLQSGEGEKPKLGQKVLVMYSGYLPDGTLFESNYEEVARKYDMFDEQRLQGGGYFPAPMDYSPDSGLIAGFKEGMLTMKVGDKVRLFIPSHLAWGPQGAGPIPPNSDVIFDIEITGIQE